MIEFGQPIALWSGLAIGLPIFAHLAYQKISEKFSFSTLRFLETSTLPRTGRRQPSDWLLLLLRILLFLMITLLLSDPYWRTPPPDIPVPQGGDERWLLFDTSPSMAGWNAWGSLENTLLSRMAEEPDANFGLLFPQESSLRENSLGSSLDEIRTTLQSAQLQPYSYGIQAMIDRVIELFSEGSRSRKVILFSDFQKSSWQEVSGTLASHDIDLELIPLGHSSGLWSHRTGNRGVIETKVAPAGSGKIRVWSLIKNWDSNLSEVQVSLLAGGQVREVVEVSLPPLGSAQVQFHLPAEDFSQALVRIEGGDSYPLDDNQSLWLLPPPPRTFGFWSQSHSDQDDTLEQKYLKTAIESMGQGDWDRWELDQKSANKLRNGTDLLGPDFLVIPGLSGWFKDENLADPLEQYLEKGGTVLITPSSLSHIQLNQSLKDTGLLDLTFESFEKIKPGIDPFRFDLVPEKSPLSEVFFGVAARDLYLTQIFQFCSTPFPENLQVPLHDRSGRPLFVIRPYPNGGKLCFSAFRILPKWTDLPMRKSFLPLLVELCSLNPPEDLEGGSLRIESGESWESSHVSFRGSQAGLFQVDGRRFEVVYPFAESIPEVMARAELADALLGHAQSDDSKVTNDLLSDASDRTSLWLWFALLVAGLFCLEMILSSPRSVLSRSQEVPLA